MKNLKMLVAGFCLSTGLMAFFSFTPVYQPAKNSQMIADWERAKAYTKEYLDASTEASIAFKPKAEMRSFAEQMLHLSDANYNLVSGATGKKSPVGQLEKGPGNKTKAELTKIVMDSYDFVINAVKEMDEPKLGTMVTIFNTDMTAEVAFNKAFEHQTHHRGQTAVYLRLSGLTPPQEKLF